MDWRLGASFRLTNPAEYGNIRHKLRKREFDMFNKGDKIIGVFGAMFPIEEGEIVSIDYDTKLNGAYAVDVMFREDGAVKKIMSSEINDAVGKLSPIGYYTEEAYYDA